MISSETKGKRARELFEALDDDGNGTLDEDEFVQVLRFLIGYFFIVQVVNQFICNFWHQIIFHCIMMYHQGCLSDEAFVKLLEDFNGDLIWGSE